MWEEGGRVHPFHTCMPPSHTYNAPPFTHSPPPLPLSLQLSQRLNVTAYPYVALLNAMPDNRVQLVAALQVWRGASVEGGKCQV